MLKTPLVYTTRADYRKAGIYFGHRHFVIHSRGRFIGLYWTSS